MDIFKSKTSKLKELIELEKQKAYQEGKFSLFHTKIINDLLNRTNDYKSLKDVYDRIKSYENDYNIPYNFGVSLEALVNNPNLVVCIHRTNLGLNRDSGIPESKDLTSIMESGLINYGHGNAGGGSAVSIGAPNLTHTTSAIDGEAGYINLVKSLMNNDTTILLAFPKELVESDGNIRLGKENKIYDIDSHQRYFVKNEFILGALLKKENGLDEFYTRDEIIENSKSKVK